jgi:hypothetical protein
MELLCPNCQKKLTVPEQYAGQLMRCPLCQGTFTVPAMPSTVAAEAAEPFGGIGPPPKPPETYGVAPEPVAAAPLPPMSTETASVATAAPPSSVTPAPATSAPSTGYARICTMRLNPHLVQWLPLGLVLAFFMTFLPWVSTVLGSANAWGIGFGDPKHTLFILFDLLTIFAAILAVASLLFGLKVVPDVPALRPVLPMRSLIVGGVAGLAWFFLTLQYGIWLLDRGFVPINFLGVLAWWVYTIAVVGAFLEFWLERRGPGKQPPRFSMEW